jgi:hypothetical protein
LLTINLYGGGIMAIKEMKEKLEGIFLSESSSLRKREVDASAFIFDNASSGEVYELALYSDWLSMQCQFGGEFVPISNNSLYSLREMGL